MQAIQSSNWMFIAAAYAASWIVIGGYALHVQHTLRRSRRALKQASASAASGANWK
jgi:hypothetical protein